MSTAIIKFSPAMPIPRIFDPDHRVKILKSHLDPRSPHYYKPTAHHINIVAAIDAYELGKIPLDATVHFRDTKIILDEEANKMNSLMWSKVRSFSF
jgi:hypothetical protein